MTSASAPIFRSLPCLSSSSGCSGFLQGWTTLWKWKLNKALVSNLLLVMFYCTNGNPKTVSHTGLGLDYFASPSQVLSLQVCTTAATLYNFSLWGSYVTPTASNDIQPKKGLQSVNLHWLSDDGSRSRKDSLEPQFLPEFQRKRTKS